MGWSGWWRTIKSFADVSGEAPSNGEVLKWNATTLRYEPVSTFVQIGDIVTFEIPTPATDGAQVIFTFANAYVSGTMQLFRDKLTLQPGGVDFTETTPSSGIVTVVSAPDSDEILWGKYIKT